MRLFKIILFLFVCNLSISSVFSQTTHVIDYNTFSNANCNAFANPPAIGISVGGYTHIPSRGQPLLTNDGTKNVVELDCNYLVNNNNYTPRGTGFVIFYPFIQGYSYNIVINAAAIATNGSGYPTMWLSIDNTTYPYSGNCTGPEIFTTTGTPISIGSNTYNDYGRLGFVPNFNNGQIAIQSQPSGNSSSQIYIRKVTIIETPPPCVAPPTGLIATSITTNSAVVNWNAVQGATSYNVYYKEAENPTWNEPILSTTTSVSLSGLQIGRLYDWRVSARCGKGSVTNFSNAQFATLGAAPGYCAPPTGMSTIPGSSSAILNWNAVPGASTYEVMFKYNPFNSTTWQTIATGISATTYTVTGLNPVQYYGWRVRALCTTGQYSYYADAENFTTTGTCPDVSNLNTSSITCNSALLSWTHPPSPAYSFAYIEYKLAATSTWITAPGTLNYTPYALTGLSAGSTYDWRVRSQCFGQSGNFLQAQFTTLPGACRTSQVTAPVFTTNELRGVDSGISNSKENQKLTNPVFKVFPSPANKELLVYTGAGYNKPISMELINISGKVVYSALSQGISKRPVLINVSEFSNGIYILKVKHGMEVLTTKVIIQH